MNKVLIVTSVASMIDQFLIPSILLLKDMGYEIEVACNFENGSSITQERIEDLKKRLETYGVIWHQVDFSRNMLKISQHICAYKKLKQIAFNGQFKMIHCHAPISSLITRIACRKLRKSGTKIIYTAHGFHFYKGAPLKNWLMYYPAEKICSHYTDILITINKEDYALAKKKMKARRVEYLPGIGVDVNRFNRITVDRKAKRKELGIPENAIVLFSVGELNKNKNHETVVRAIADTDIYYIVAGKGEMQEYLQSIVDGLGISERVQFLGYRNDISALCAISDMFVFPSFREGLSMSVMEAMASGLPCALSEIRGNVDLIDENGGTFFDPHSVVQCKEAIMTLLQSDLTKKGRYNLEKVQNYDVSTVNKLLQAIYESI